MLRNIITIDESKCNGCGQCVTACAEGAIAIINGKAKLVSQTYCDGLGACLGHCPTDAIKIEQKEAAAFDEEAVKKHLAASQSPAAKRFAEIRQETQHAHGGCPGMAQRKLRDHADHHHDHDHHEHHHHSHDAARSELTHWPIQLKLVSPGAPFLKNADVLLVGDCVPFAMGDFHARFLKDHVLLVGCPKLDDSQYYVDKLAQIIESSGLSSLTIVHMEVPCCFGLKRIAQAALEKTAAKLELKDITISLKGEVI